MDEYIDVKLDIFEHVGQRIRLRKSLTISGLIEEILREFDDIAADAPEKYAVFLKGMDRPLNASSTMEQLDLQPQDELVFEYVHQNIRRMLTPENYAFLRDEANQRVYDIQWQPAIIGRPTNEAEHNIMLAVNLQLHPKGLTVSRKHAEITFADGHYYLEPLAENNPVAVNDKLIPFGTRRELKNGDKIILGRNDLPLTFLTQSAASAAQKPAVSHPVPSQPKPAPLPQPAAPERVAQPTPVQPGPLPVAEDDGNKTRLGDESAPISRLVIERSSTPEQTGQQWLLTTYPSQIGRNLPLLQNEKDVSRAHLEVNYNLATRKFLIMDLNSQNGVFLEGLRLAPQQPIEIKPGMKIGLGANVVLRFEI
jgi:pSer/pThr/pTyr-binding forkhead associated (FHA) protein